MSLSVLIVDDSEADQFLFAHALKKCDKAVTTYKAYDGKEAINLIDSGTCTPDYIFLDINMPGMNGIEFLEAYNHLQLSHASFIVMLTSSIREDDFNRCMEYAHVKSCLSKPISIDELSKCLSQ